VPDPLPDPLQAAAPQPAEVIPPPLQQAALPPQPELPQPELPEPPKADVARIDPPKPEPIKPEPIKPEPPKAEPPKAAPKPVAKAPIKPPPAKPAVKQQIVKPVRPAKPAAAPPAAQSVTSQSTASSADADSVAPGQASAGTAASGTGSNSADGTQVASLPPGPIGAFDGQALAARFRTTPLPPVYPKRALAQNQQGVATVRALIDERGHPQDIRLYASSGFPMLDRAALEAVSHWDFLPASRDGHAVPAWVEVPVRFHID
jgi:protein TonB